MNILDTLVKTPLFELKSFGITQRNVRIFAKGEFMNISGSVKDRAAKAMIADGIKKGLLTKEKTIIDATSGNTGIAYAMIGAALGYGVKLFMPSNVTAERRQIMQAYGAEVIMTSALEGIDGAYYEVMNEVQKNRDKYFYPNQYTNNQNWLAHYHGTADEIIEQTNGTVTHFVAGTGTSGTFVGCTKKLKEYNGKIKCYNMTPDSPFHGIEGIKYKSALLDNGFYYKSISDGTIAISTETAYEFTKQITRKEGLFVGISSGANVAAAVKIAEKAPRNSVIVTVLCDNGSRYLSESVWSD